MAGLNASMKTTPLGLAETQILSVKELHGEKNVKISHTVDELGSTSENTYVCISIGVEREEEEERGF